jgi:hypothetical protein
MTHRVNLPTRTGSSLRNGGLSKTVTIDSWGVVDLFFDISENRGIKEFTDKVQELKIKHGEVRYVFQYG